MSPVTRPVECRDPGIQDPLLGIKSAKLGGHYLKLQNGPISAYSVNKEPGGNNQNIIVLSSSVLMDWMHRCVLFFQQKVIFYGFWWKNLQIPLFLLCVYRINIRNKQLTSPTETGSQIYPVGIYAHVSWSCQSFNLLQTKIKHNAAINS